MKTPFIIRVRAPDAATAWVRAKGVPPEKRGYVEIADTADQVVRALAGKMRRARDNPGLYADKIAEYQRIQADYEAQRGSDPELAVVALLLAHGDIRVDNQQKAAVRALGGGQWAVFGYAFGG